ncbi:MAG: hypothetical protein ABSB78_00855 [Bacteroidota bacterium]
MNDKSRELLAVRTLSEELHEEQRGRIYNGDIGDTLGNDVPASIRTQSSVRGRKRRVKKRLSIFNVLLTLAIGSAIVLLYIYNTIRVGELLHEIGNLDSAAQKLSSINEVLRAEINRKSALERIGTIAQTELHLQNPTQQPIWFSLDSEAVQHSTFIREREGVR